RWARTASARRLVDWSAPRRPRGLRAGAVCLVAPWRAAASSCVSLTCDTGTAGTIEPADETDCYQFSVMDGETAGINVATTGTARRALRVWRAPDHETLRPQPLKQARNPPQLP